jgi:hypothetical protein
MRSTLNLAVLAGTLVLAGACSSSPGTANGPAPTPTNADAAPMPMPTSTADAALPPPGDDAGDDSGDMTMDDGATPATEYDAKLTGAEVVPAVLTSAAGTATFFLQPDGVTLQYDITQNVNGGTAAALHIAAPAENAAVAYPITPFSGHMSGSITLSSDDANSLTAGMMYVDIQSAANPAGEVRGQLVTPGSTIFVTYLNGDQELPPVQTSNDGHASFILDAAMDTVIYHFVTSATPTDININRAIGALTGPVAFPFAPNIGQEEDGTLTLAGNDANDLAMGHFYVNVVSAAYPAGELRGQVMMPGESLYTATLSGLNEVPHTSSQASGAAQFILGADRASLRYELDVTGTIPTEADLASGAAGQNGSVLSTLVLNATGAQGTQAIASNQVSLMGSQMLYVNVKTASYPTGELRGQLGLR